MNIIFQKLRDLPKRKTNRQMLSDLLYDYPVNKNNITTTASPQTVDKELQEPPQLIETTNEAPSLLIASSFDYKEPKTVEALNDNTPRPIKRKLTPYMSHATVVEEEQVPNTPPEFKEMKEKLRDIQRMQQDQTNRSAINEESSNSSNSSSGGSKRPQPSRRATENTTRSSSSNHHRSKTNHHDHYESDYFNHQQYRPYQYNEQPTDNYCYKNNNNHTRSFPTRRKHTRYHDYDDPWPTYRPSTHDRHAGPSNAYTRQENTMYSHPVEHHSMPDVFNHHHYYQEPAMYDRHHHDSTIPRIHYHFKRSMYHRYQGYHREEAYHPYFYYPYPSHH